MRSNGGSGRRTAAAGQSLGGGQFPRRSRRSAGLAQHSSRGRAPLGRHDELAPRELQAWRLLRLDIFEARAHAPSNTGGGRNVNGAQEGRRRFLGPPTQAPAMRRRLHMRHLPSDGSQCSPMSYHSHASIAISQSCIQTTGWCRWFSFAAPLAGCPACLPTAGSAAAATRPAAGAAAPAACFCRLMPFSDCLSLRERPACTAGCFLIAGANLCHAWAFSRPPTLTVPLALGQLASPAPSPPHEAPSTQLTGATPAWSPPAGTAAACCRMARRAAPASAPGWGGWVHG